MYRKVGGTRKKASTHKRKAAPHRRRRRISGTNDISGMAIQAGGLIAGAIIARELNTVVVKQFPSFSPMMSGAVQVGVGLILPKFVKGDFVANIGKGMVTNGGLVLVVSTGLISGINDRMAYRVVNGTGNLKVVNGTGNLQVVNGPQTRISNTVIPRVPVKSFNSVSY